MENYTVTANGFKLTPAALFNGLQNPKDKVSDNIGEKVTLMAVVQQVQEFEVREDDKDGEGDRKKGEKYDAPRIVFFTSTGSTYFCVSATMANCLERLWTSFNVDTKKNTGMPKEGLSVKFVQTKSGKGRNCLMLELQE